MTDDPQTSSTALERNEFVEYMNLFPDPELLTKSELIETAREHGVRISDRQLTTYVTEGIIPKSVRVGSRAGVFPAAVADLLIWVSRTRDRGVSVEGIKQLVPLWKFIMRSHRDASLDLGAFEHLARSTVTHREAVYAIPSIFVSCLRCPNCLLKMKFVLKNGEVQSHTLEHPFTLSFEIASEDEETGKVQREAAVRMMMPLPDITPDDPALLIIGIPEGSELPAVAEDEEDHPSGVH